ncbi:DUF2612 domain-containing protein [Pandoraea sp. NPDC090278]|uniref:DUF2612 domain-containing protein n=1 Tax=Pandoraea sp. NPDC090278 TaxID=3364391 RepID=UPI00383A6C45
MADITDYTGKITSEHADKPRYAAMVLAVTQCFVDVQNALASLPTNFDLDSAVGVQLDAIGLWVGVSRNIKAPLAGVYFSFDIKGVGFDQGVWRGPFDPDTGVVALDDDTYRLVLRARIGANHWDGTLAGTAGILGQIFPTGAAVAVHALGEPFGMGDGATKAFQIQYQQRPVHQVTTATLFRNDWQGNQRLYATSRTNSLQQSGSMTTAPWSSTVPGYLGARTSSTAIAAPDGTATPVTVINVTNNNLALRQTGLSVPVGTRTASLWVYVPSGQPGVTGFKLSVDWNDIDNGSSSAVSTSFDRWVRLSSTASVTAARTQLDFNLTAQSSNFPVGSVLYVSFAQDEPGAVATSYIATTNAAASVTDYSLGATGVTKMTVPPPVGATLTWCGDGIQYPNGTYAFVQDNQDMSITVGIAGQVPSALFLALLSGGYIPIKPQAVRVNYYLTTSKPGTPIFGFDMSNGYVNGFDVGAWAVPL